MVKAEKMLKTLKMVKTHLKTDHCPCRWDMLVLLVETRQNAHTIKINQVSFLLQLHCLFKPVVQVEVSIVLTQLMQASGKVEQFSRGI
jgi:hypothetical protein